jgi:GntR family transcriptional regulator
MPKENVTTEDVTQAIMHRITTGKYAPGERLPSVRDLAEEIGANRTTVNKAYQTLMDLGVLEPNPGGRRGFSVKQLLQVSRQTKSELLEYFYQQSVDLVWQGMAAGMSADEILDQLKAAVGDVYGHSEVRMIFFECNEHDTVEMGQSLNKTLGMRVEYRVIDYLYANFPTVLHKYDLIITTYHHLAEITAELKKMGESPARVVGIETRPTPETMLRVARLLSPRIGLVCTIQNTAHMLKHIFYGYHPDWEIDTATSDQPEVIQQIGKTSDHLVVTHTCAEEVKSLTGRSPDVIVDFQIDEQSIAFLAQRIYDIQMQKMKPFNTVRLTQETS